MRRSSDRKVTVLKGFRYSTFILFFTNTALKTLTPTLKAKFGKSCLNSFKDPQNLSLSTEELHLCRGRFPVVF